MGRVNHDVVELLRDQFRALDVDGSGKLDAEDVRMLEAAVKAMDKHHAMNSRVSAADDPRLMV